MRSVLLALALCVATVVPARADRISLDYSGTAWGVVGVGSAHLDVDVDGDAYTAAGMVRTAGVAALFLQTQINVNAGGAFENGSVRWRRYYLDHMYDGVHRYITMRPNTGSVEASINPTYPEWGNPPATDQQKLAARDPLSSLIAMAADVGATHRCQGQYMTFDGRWLYRLDVRDGGIARMSQGGYRGWAVRCHVRYFPVAGFAPDDQGYRDPPPPGVVWFALLDGKRLAPPIRAAMPLPLGTASFSLRRWRTIPDPPNHPPAT
jgi:hypothetical protein